MFQVLESRELLSVDVWIDALSSTATKSTSVVYRASFSQAVQGLTARNFALGGTAAAGATIGNLRWLDPSHVLVTVSAPIEGRLELNIANSTGIRDGYYVPQTLTQQSSGVYTIDRTAPVLTLSYTPSGYTSSDSVGLGVSVSDNVAQSWEIQFQTKIDNGIWTSNSYYSGLSDGAHTLYARAIDSAGNISAQKTYKWTIDHIAPTASILSGPGSIVPVNSATFSFDVSDNIATASQLTYTVLNTHDNKSLGTFHGTSFTLAGLADTTYDLSIRVSDLAGNYTTLYPPRFVVSVAPPTANFVSYTPAYSKQPKVTFGVTGYSYNTELNYVPGIARTIMASIDGGAWFDTGISPDYSSSDLAIPTINGLHRVQLRLTDSAGHSSTPFTISTVVDTLGPKIATYSISDSLTLAAPTFRFGFSEAVSLSGLQVQLYDNDSGSTIYYTPTTTTTTTTTGGTTKSLVFTPAALVAGHHYSLQLVAADLAGNSLAWSGASFTKL